MKEETRYPDVPRFHYKREERMADLPDHIRDRGKKSVFRGNRSLLITLIDVVFLAMLVIVFSVVTRLTGDNRVVPGYSVTANAIEFGDRTLVSVKVVSREDYDGRAQIRIGITYVDGEERIELAGFLPSEKGDEEVYRGALQSDPSSRSVRIDLSTSSSRGTMTARIRQE